MEYISVRVFTKDRRGGNLAAVVMVPKDREYTKEMMQTAATLIGYSETVFIKTDEKKQFSFLFFTPCKEVEMCGHGAIGSFFVLKNNGLVEENKPYEVQTKDGIIRLISSGDSVLLEMTNPRVERELSIKEELELGYIMGLIPDEPQKVGAAIVSCGLSDILLPISSKKKLDELEPDFTQLAHFSEQQGVVGVHAYYLDEKTKQIYTRNFAPLYGIDEESATGTSNGGLAFYLWKKGLLESDIEQVIIQGEAMNQASKIMVKIESSIPRVHVGGTVILELIDKVEIIE
jgi:PhzF family phenazine biosynthesis protein